MNTLLAAHVATDPAEATLVLAAVAAFHGLKADGERLAEVADVATTLRSIAGELGVHVGVARRGVAHLVATGVLTADRAGVHVTAAALRDRWERRSATIRLSADVRSLGLRCEPLLVAGLVAAQVDRRGRLVISTGRLATLTGLPRRTLQRAIEIAEDAGAVHHWCYLNGRMWQMCFAPGQRREVAQEKRREVAQENPPPPPGRREVAQEKTDSAASRSGAVSRREVAQETASRSGASTPDTEYNPSDARARARADRDPIPEPAAEPAKTDPELALQRAIERTTIRDRLPPFPRRIFARDWARTLHSSGMTAAQFDALWALAQRRSKGEDPGGLLIHWIAGDWRGVLAEPESKDRHADAMARGASARAAEERDGCYGAPAPATAAELVGAVVARVRLA